GVQQRLRQRVTLCPADEDRAVRTAIHDVQVQRAEVRISRGVEQQIVTVSHGAIQDSRHDAGEVVVPWTEVGGLSEHETYAICSTCRKGAGAGMRTVSKLLGRLEHALLRLGGNGRVLLVQHERS